jgi:signal transduction histidine kinase
LRIGLLLGPSVIVVSILAAILLPKGFALAVFGDALQDVLLAGLTIVAFRNFLRSHFQARIFWFLIFSGAFFWTLSNSIWTFYELFLGQLVPDVPAGDILLFVKMVPFTAAAFLIPNPRQDSRFRVFGLLDVLILMLYSLYLYAFGVFAYRLLPGGLETYNFRFNLAEGFASLVFAIVAGIATLRSQEQWRLPARLYFLAAVCYGVTCNLNDVAIDLGRYYTGSLYDIPLLASMTAFLCACIAGRNADRQQTPAEATDDASSPQRTAFASSHLAMLVALTTPGFGIWLLSSASGPPQLRFFRLVITLLTIFFLTLLVSIKQDLMTSGLFGSLNALSKTYGRIEQFKTHLAQSEKLASLGELVAQAANQIKGCMAAVLEASSQFTSRPDTDARIQNMAGKIGRYALRTDVLVDNMLHFAQETPLRLAPLDVKPLLESALHLSRIAKLPNVRADLTEEGNCPKVLGDSGQLMHVFLQLISNAVDALDEVGGGTFDVTIRPAPAQLILEFADSGPGIQELQRVFEPFYTTKPVGKGTGLGLSTCYGIIQQHEGEIFCRNRLGGGAVFTILLPIAPEPFPANSKESDNLLVEGVR